MANRILERIGGELLSLPEVGLGQLIPVGVHKPVGRHIGGFVVTCGMLLLQY